MRGGPGPFPNGATLECFFFFVRGGRPVVGHIVRPSVGSRSRAHRRRVIGRRATQGDRPFAGASRVSGRERQREVLRRRGRFAARSASSVAASPGCARPARPPVAARGSATTATIAATIAPPAMTAFPLVILIFGSMSSMRGSLPPRTTRRPAEWRPPPGGAAVVRRGASSLGSDCRSVGLGGRAERRSWSWRASTSSRRRARSRRRRARATPSSRSWPFRSVRDRREPRRTGPADLRARRCAAPRCPLRRRPRRRSATSRRAAGCARSGRRRRRRDRSPRAASGARSARPRAAELLADLEKPEVARRR